MKYETIYDCWFLVNFKTNMIITWSIVEETMYKHQREFVQLDLDVVVFDELTEQMKSSLDIYTGADLKGVGSA